MISVSTAMIAPGPVAAVPATGSADAAPASLFDALLSMLALDTPSNTTVPTEPLDETGNLGAENSLVPAVIPALPFMAPGEAPLVVQQSPLEAPKTAEDASSEANALPTMLVPEYAGDSIVAEEDETPPADTEIVTQAPPEPSDDSDKSIEFRGPAKAKSVPVSEPGLPRPQEAQDVAKATPPPDAVSLLPSQPVPAPAPDRDRTKPDQTEPGRTEPGDASIVTGDRTAVTPRGQKPAAPPNDAPLRTVSHADRPAPEAIAAPGNDHPASEPAKNSRNESHNAAPAKDGPPPLAPSPQPASPAPLIATIAASAVPPPATQTAVQAPNTEMPLALTTASAQQADMDALALKIAAKSAAGESNFHIRLDPPELGRIDIHLNMDSHGNAHANLSADKPQTLDLLQKDALALERALKDAGLDVSGGLSFSLKGDGKSGAWREAHGSGRSRVLQIAIDGGLTNEAAAANAGLYGQGWGVGSARLDIRV